ncbi:MAG TPA: lipid droplet-associated protein [Pseudonocardiaceae bacterium]|jgi:hypothetical protein|nr:lipid droplet-associated protein [Pseudonocardiaceae bacterium]
MKPLPLPMRIAAGLAVTAVDQARRLPEKLAELPVTMVSQALQLSMRVQQQVTELAIRGDDLLAGLRPIEEAPEWARFDEDDPGSAGANGTAGGHSGTGAGLASATANGARSRFDTVTLAAVADLDETELDETELDNRSADPADDSGHPADSDHAVEAEPADDTTDARAMADAHETADDLPPPLSNYPELTVPRLRARLRRLSIPELELLLHYERAHANRPEFTGMLARRIANVRATR